MTSVARRVADLVQDTADAEDAGQYEGRKREHSPHHEHASDERPKVLDHVVNGAIRAIIRADLFPKRRIV